MEFCALTSCQKVGFLPMIVRLIDNQMPSIRVVNGHLLYDLPTDPN